MILDILALIAVGIGIYLGYRKGFVRSIFTVIAWIVGLFAALKLTALGSELFRKWFHTHSAWVPLITFIIIFTGVVILVIFSGKLVDKIISVAQLGLFNKILGGLMKGVVFLLLFSVLLWLFNEAGVISPEMKAQSKTYGFVSSIAPGFFHFIDRNLPALSGLLDNLKKYFQHFDIMHAVNLQEPGLKSYITENYSITPPLRVGLVHYQKITGFSPVI